VSAVDLPTKIRGQFPSLPLPPNDYISFNVNFLGVIILCCLCKLTPMNEGVTIQLHAAIRISFRVSVSARISIT